MYDLTAIAIGNTHTYIGYFIKNELLKTNKRKTKYISSTLNLASSNKILISSVVPKATEIIKRKYPLAEKITNTPLLQFPSNIGIDRIINCYSAITLYKTKNVLIIDAGTALTITCCINMSFKGGLIMPGIGITKKVLLSNTSLLKKSAETTELNLFQKDTDKAITAGILNLFIRSLNSLIIDYKKQTSQEITVVLTGGDSLWLNDYLENINVVNPTLLLEGLNLLN